MTPRWPFLALLVGVAAIGMHTVSDDPGAVPAPGSLLTAGPDGSPAAGPGLGSAGPPASAGSATWYCAAGTVGGESDHRLVVTNQGGDRVEGSVRLFSEEAPSGPGPEDASAEDPELSHPVVVPAEGDAEVVLAQLDDPVVDGVNAEREAFVAALLEFDGAVTVEHQLEGAPGRVTTPCSPRGASEWHFAWGTTTRDAHDLLVLFNPFPNDVVLDASFATGDGVRAPVRWQGLVVPSGRVLAVDVGEDVTRREQVAASLRARGGSLVVERLHSFDGSLGVEGAWLAAGHPEPATSALFPAVQAHDQDRELLAVYNPGDVVAEVDVQVRPVGAELPRPFRLVVRPDQVRVLDFTEESRIEIDQERITVVESTNDVPVVAQHIVL